MDLYYAGAEQPVYMRQLYGLGVRRMAISFYEWRRRHSSDTLYKHVPEDVKICITAGIARKKDIDFKTFAKDYIEFCEQNAEDALVYGMDAPFSPLAIQLLVRKQLSVLPNLVAFPLEDEDPAALTNEYERIGINATRGKSTPMSELRRLQATLYGSNITDPKKLRDGRFAATTTQAWLSPKLYGEMWVFGHNRLRHYGADSLARAVRAHRDDIEGFGLDVTACAANDPQALTALAVMSLGQMAESLTKRRRDNQMAETAAVSPNPADSNAVASQPKSPAVPTGNGGPNADKERERTLIPVISVNELEGQQKVTVSQGNVRRCDSCSISELCPGFEPESVCKYSVPIEIRSKAQLEQAASVLLEAQFQRVQFGLLAEQIDGGDLRSRVGQEMDRWFKIVGSIKDLATPETKPAGAMTRFFQQAQSQLGAPADDDGEEGDEEDDDTIEGEVVDDEEQDSSDLEDAPVGAAQ